MILKPGYWLVIFEYPENITCSKLTKETLENGVNYV